MQVVYQRCCGLDIHKKLIVACLLIMSSQGEQKESRTFSTTLADLYRLRARLRDQLPAPPPGSLFSHEGPCSQGPGASYDQTVPTSKSADGRSVSCLSPIGFSTICSERLLPVSSLKRGGVLFQESDREEFVKFS